MLQQQTTYTTQEETLLQLVERGCYELGPLADAIGWEMAVALTDNLFYSDVTTILGLHNDEVAEMMLSDIIASTEYWQYSDKVGIFCRVMRALGKIA